MQANTITYNSALSRIGCSEWQQQKALQDVGVLFGSSCLAALDCAQVLVSEASSGKGRFTSSRRYRMDIWAGEESRLM